MRWSLSCEVAFRAYVTSSAVHLEEEVPSRWQSSPCAALTARLAQRISTVAHAAPAARAGCSSRVLSPCGVILCAPLAAAARVPGALHGIVQQVAMRRALAGA